MMKSTLALRCECGRAATIGFTNQSPTCPVCAVMKKNRWMVKNRISHISANSLSMLPKLGGVMISPVG